MKGYEGSYPKYTISQIYFVVYMKYSNQNNLLVDYQTIVAKLWEAEQTRNFEAAISAFEYIWDNFDFEPDFSSFNLIQQAELFRLSGHFLGNYGKSKNLISYQERGKNLLTQSIEIYWSLNEFNKLADAQNALAMCYIREGAILEAEIILEQTVFNLPDKLDLVYLQNRGNLLITKNAQKKYKEALEIIEEISVPMDFCLDKKACFVFHEKAGNLFGRLKLFSKAIIHQSRAIEYANELGNLAFLTSAKNNLANLYRIIGRFDLAHLNEDEAIQIAKEDNQIGWIPHFLDTKATIYFDEGNVNAALETIDEAISIFQKGEDAGGLTEALWNKCRFLLYLDRKQEAIKLFAELASIATDKMGEFALNNFSDEFAELIHVKQKGSLEEETKRFRRAEIINAIRKSDYELSAAAILLKISHHDLTKIVDQEFPELLEEINIERFAAINDGEKDEIISHQRNISRLYLDNEITNLPENTITFYFASDSIEEVLGISTDFVIALKEIKEITVGDYVLMFNKIENLLVFGKIQYDTELKLYFFNQNGVPYAFTMDEVELIGKAVSFLPFSEIDSEKLNFKPFDF